MVVQCILQVSLLDPDHWSTTVTEKGHRENFLTGQPLIPPSKKINEVTFLLVRVLELPLEAISYFDS